MPLDTTIFATTVQSAAGRQAAHRMIASLRTFGGSLSRQPVWVFSPPPLPLGEGWGEGVEMFPLSLPETVKGYLFAEKVFACAQAEEMAKGWARSLVWIDPGMLVVNPPLLFDLAEDYDAALRPVHITNVGLEAGAPLDGFWSKIYAAVGAEDIQQTVETFVRQQRIRAYFNSHAFAINPRLGMLGQWAEMFQGLVSDQEFQAACCADELHQIFLFQALLSALLVSRLDWERIRVLPPAYNYPYHLQAKIPARRRAGTLNELVSIAYEECSLNPDQMTDIGVDEPLRSWLASHPA